MLQSTWARVVIRRLYGGRPHTFFSRTYIGKTADPDVHASDSSAGPSLFSGDPEGTRQVYEPKYDAEEDFSSDHDVPKSETTETDPLVLPRPLFSSSQKIESVEVAPPVEPIVQQKRRETSSSSSSHPVSGEISCADLDDCSPWPPKEKDREETAVVEDDDSDMEYYRRHKASPLSHVKFVNTRKPITRATSGTADSGYYGGVPDTVGWRPEQLDTAEEALLRAARIWKDSAMTGDPDSPQSRVLRTLRGENTMDAAGMGSPFGDFIHPSDRDHMRNILATDDTSQSSVCARCRSSYVPDGDLDSCTICSDCKFLLAENFVNPVHESRGRAHGGRRIGRRRTGYSSSESTAGDFSRQFSEIMSRIRHSQSTIHGDHYSDWETNIRLSQNTSSHSTPSNSRRWVMANSDAESGGFDNGDSFYGESESSVSFSCHRRRNGDGETISFSAYGWDSDNSVDGRYTMDSEMHFPPGDGSDIESDTDIDPMHVGINQWRLDLQGEDEAEGDEDDEEDEWEEESNGEEENADSVDVVGSQLASPLVSPAPAANNSSDLYQLTVFPEIDGMIRWSIREGRGSDTAGYMLPYLDGLELPSNVVNSRDYLNSGSFEDLLEYLAENDTSRRGAPPASVSFVNSLPLVVIDEDTVKCDSAITCAICKDIFVIGNKVNRLPCGHLYHPSCILPWVSTRNSCPLCRYELPTDDKDYEAEKQENNQSMRGNRENGWQGLVEDDFTEGGEGEEEPDLSGQISEQTEGLEETFSVRGERRRGRWLFLSAAPIVSIMGIAVVLFLVNPLGRGRAHNIGLSGQRMRHSGGFGSSRTNRTDCKTRRWWLPF